MPKAFDITPFLKECIEKLEEGQSIRMIAKSIGVDHCTISRRLRENGVTVPTRNESAKRTWKNHKHPHLGKKGEESYVFGKKMSKEVKERMRPIWDELAAKQRLGRKKHSGGYVLVYSPEHPSADRSGYVLEHRLKVEESLGRYLTSDEIVHHKNGDKSDNRIENLVLTNRSEHAKTHRLIGGI